MSAAELSSSARTISWLLRSPAEVAERCRADDDVKQLAAVSLAAIAMGGAAFGAVIGSFRGGTQILFAAVKIPLAVLLALAICVPAFHTLAAVLGRPWPLRTVVSLTLAASARASLLLLAFAPALWLAYDCGLGYHGAALVAAGAYAVAGMAALSILLRGLGPGRGRIATMLAFCLLFFSVAGQTSWIMRPYLVRPKTTALPFVRAREGSFLDSVWTSAHSAAGIYDSDSGGDGGRGRSGASDRDAIGDGSGDSDIDGVGTGDGDGNGEGRGTGDGSADGIGTGDRTGDGSADGIGTGDGHRTGHRAMRHDGAEPW